MPLDRSHISPASWIMLPVYMVAFLWLGLNYMFTPLARLTASPTLDFVNGLLDLRALGFLLVCAGMFIGVALYLTHNRMLARYALIVAGLCFLVLLVAFVSASFRSEASPSAGAWPFIGLGASFATYQSVTKRQAN